MMTNQVNAASFNASADLNDTQVLSHCECVQLHAEMVALKNPVLKLEKHYKASVEIILTVKCILERLWILNLVKWRNLSRMPWRHKRERSSSVLKPLEQSNCDTVTQETCYRSTAFLSPILFPLTFLVCLFLRNAWSDTMTRG